jgi:glucokinase
LEVFASTSGLEARAREALAGGEPSALSPTTVTFDQLIAAARDGDPLACRLLDRAATYLGLAVANAIDNWDPELVVLSGPLIRETNGLLDTLLAAEQRSVLETGRAGVRVVPALLDGDVKIVGAATLLIADYLATPLYSAPDVASWE